MFNRLTDVPQTSAANDLSKTVLEKSEELAVKIASSIAKTKKAKAANVLTSENRVQECFTAAGKLLIASSLASSGMISPPVTLALTEESKLSFPSPHVDVDDESELLTQVQLSRRDALEDLKESMKMLHTELALSSLTSKGS